MDQTFTTTASSVTGVRTLTHTLAVRGRRLRLTAPASSGKRVTLGRPGRASARQRWQITHRGEGQTTRIVSHKTGLFLSGHRSRAEGAPVVTANAASGR